MSRILLGVCGGIAAYKAAAIASALVQRGDEIDVILTEEAQRFIGPLTFAALARRRVFTSLWDAPEMIAHISLVRENDVFVIVPATAHTIAKLAHGLADDLLTNCALAARIPMVIAPAMNSAMYEHPATRENVRTLLSRGCELVEPEAGFLAEREHGTGRLAEPAAIFSALDRVLARRRTLEGQRVMITAGPTREAIDPVRFLSNASTGLMGIELAREASARGAKVDLIVGPTSLDIPANIHVTHVTTAQEMFHAANAIVPGADIAIAAAAVVDWRPKHVFAHKVKKVEGDDVIELERTPDTLLSLGEKKQGTFLVGFAAETERHEEYAREKLRVKHIDAIAVNDVGGERGFGAGESELVLLYGADGRIPLGVGNKRELASRLWDALLEVRERVRCS